MTLTDETQGDTICQPTQHAMLIPWGRFSRYLGLSERVRAAVRVRRHQDAAPGGDLLLEFGLASLAGYECLQDLNAGALPLVKDQAVADEWDIQFRHYTVLSRFLYALEETDVARVEAELLAVIQPYIEQSVHQVLCHRQALTLCGDLTGRPVSAYSVTYPPDAVFGHMANQLRKGHQAFLVTMQGLVHRVHVAVLHRPGNASAKRCLRESVETTEVRLGCRPRRRTALLHQRIATVEAQIAKKTQWIETQRAVIRQQIERQDRLGAQLRALQPRLEAVTAQRVDAELPPHSTLAHARQQKATWERQLQSAFDQEARARRVCVRHQQHLAPLTAQRNELVRWLAQLEADNATNPNPVPMRWLLDGCFGDADSVTYLVEMGYDLYTIANGQTTKALRSEVPDGAQWTQVGVRTQGLEMTRQQMGRCPYALRLTLLRWQEKDCFQYSTLLSFSESESLPTAELFPLYHQRQDVEAGIKQGKGTFGFTKLRVRSPAGIRLLGQFALFFWPNFVHWAASWLADRMEAGAPLLQHVRRQVRVAARTPAVVLTNGTGQLVEFSACGPYPGLCIPLDQPFAYQLPMPLFEAGQQTWPVSSESVKEQLTVILAKQSLSYLADVWPAPLEGQLPENVPKNQVFDRLVL
jgi:uncharacterized coiled-coil protein SlyX